MWICPSNPFKDPPIDEYSFGVLKTLGVYLAFIAVAVGLIVFFVIQITK